MKAMFLNKFYNKYLPFSPVKDTIFTNENGKGEIVMDDIQKVEKLLKNKNYQFFYLKEELYEIGIVEMKTPYGNKVKVYDLERTICDIIRNKKKIEIALFTDAMKRYADRKDRNSIKLHKYAKIFNIEDELRKYLEVLL